MNALIYLDDLNWANDALGIVEYGYTPNLVTHDARIGESLKRYFHKVYYPSKDGFYTDLIIKLVKSIDLNEYKVIITPSTQKGRIVAGIISGLTGYTVYSDVISIDFNENTLERLVYGGLGKAQIKFEYPVIITISKGLLKIDSPKTYEGHVEVVDVGKSVMEVDYSVREAVGVDPTKADVVVGAGRGFKSREDLKMVEELSSELNGAWSVTRPLSADYGWCSHWIGISGLVINPKVYIVFGSSGQPHHMLGARGSKVIIAVNKDESAPIFQECDYGVVGDLYTILPKLIEKIRELKKL